MLFSQAPLSSVPFSSLSGVAFSAAIALTQPASLISISGKEIFQAAIALTQPASLISITDIFFECAIALTQSHSSINLLNYNGIAPWTAAPVQNTPIRKVAPTLAEIRNAAPSLVQIRQNQPTLVE